MSNKVDHNDVVAGPRIGAGTYGTVHESSSNPKLCVVKVYKQPVRAPPCAPLLREWAVLAAMRGRFNVLPAYRFDTSAPSYRLTMPRGLPLWPHTLREYVGNASRASTMLMSAVQNCAFDLFTQLLGTVLLVGTEHRDIKPHNIVATVQASRTRTRVAASRRRRIDAWRFHLIDYGAAKYASCYPSTFVTTHIYRPPEKLRFQTQFGGDKMPFPRHETREWAPRFDTQKRAVLMPYMKMRWSERVDAWAMGVVLFEMITGEHFVPLGLWCTVPASGTESSSGSFCSPMQTTTTSDSEDDVEKNIFEYHLQRSTEWRMRLCAVVPPSRRRDQLVDLIARCVEINPGDRASLRECWEHPFVQDATARCSRRTEQREQLVHTRPTTNTPKVCPSLKLHRALCYLLDKGCTAGLRCHTLFAAARLLKRCSRAASPTMALMCLRLASKMCGDNGLHRPAARRRAPLALESTHLSPTAEQERSLFMHLLPHLCDAVANNLWTLSCYKEEEEEEALRTEDDEMVGSQQQLVTPSLGYEMRDDPNSLYCSLRRACLDPRLWHVPLKRVVAAVLRVRRTKPK